MRGGCGLHLLFTVLMIGVGLWILFGADLAWYQAWLLALTVVTFGYYWFDKFQAQRKGWRVPELWLHGLAFAGGFLGGWAGMFWFRHKTQHFWFKVLLVLATLLHLWLINVGLVSLN